MLTKNKTQKPQRDTEKAWMKSSGPEFRKPEEKVEEEIWGGV